jgi:hypothetical protein
LLNTGFADVSVFNVTRDRAVLVCRKNPPAVSRTVHDHVALLAFVTAPPAVLEARKPLTFDLRVTNRGRARWPAIGLPETKGIVRLGAHLLAADEEELNWDAGRAAISRDLAPGETAELEFVFRAPEKAGDYIIEFDIVAEHLTWFEDFGPGVLRHRFTVR